MANHKPMKRKCRKRKNKVTQPYARWVVVDEKYPMTATIEELRMKVLAIMSLTYEDVQAWYKVILNPSGYINWSSRG